MNEIPDMGKSLNSCKQYVSIRHKIVYALSYESLFLMKQLYEKVSDS